MKKGKNPAQVLIVDDEKDLCWALHKILEVEGLAVSVAVSSRAALEAVKKNSFQVVFVDAKLPDVDGIELAKCIRSLRPETRCILISGYLYEDDAMVREGLEGGTICAFVSKPFRISEVVSVARAAVASPPS